MNFTKVKIISLLVFIFLIQIPVIGVIFMSIAYMTAKDRSAPGALIFIGAVYIFLVHQTLKQLKLLFPEKKGLFYFIILFSFFALQGLSVWWILS